MMDFSQLMMLGSKAFSQVKSNAAVARVKVSADGHGVPHAGIGMLRELAGLAKADSYAVSDQGHLRSAGTGSAQGAASSFECLLDVRRLRNSRR
jgi:hypothetical protein